MLYFDHCASTPPFDEVIQTVSEVMKLQYSNPSSIHQAGVAAEKLVTRAREVMASALQVQPNEILFTSGATESNNLAIQGAAMQKKSRGNHIITTGIEHASVYECCRLLERRGFQVTYLPVDSSGRIRITDLRAAITEQTILVSIMHVNNEVGSIQPIEAIGEVLKEYPRILFHVDGVQGLGKVPVKLHEWGVDLYSISAHKLRGPKGVGVLYCREGVQIQPLFAGGEQERGLRAGTLNVPNNVAMAKAVRMTLERQETAVTKLRELRQHLIQGIDSIPELVLNSSRNLEEGAPHVVHFSYPGMKPEVIIHKLEQHGIVASTQSACSSKDLKPSRVLLAMGCNEARASGGIRISMDAEQSIEDIVKLAEALRIIVKELKPLEKGQHRR
ncbi:cysteine desulfurase NifS [Paenibacillus selenitireducens]|uniref:Cysteine desulfurase NifS n=1 Tax=Paenibacillus selenitireducens TaxID=1324314 RepID=A0A1T2XFP3_9BACL|nr:cysteine desulfurase family protein [Paenibacillus selenitireducens]OPA78433.1 cysteine desulfurase NifS [Paenibacillus selenitireducens]